MVSSDASSSVPRHFVSFAPRYHRRYVCSLAAIAYPFAAPGRDHRLVPSAFSVKTMRPPRFPGAPMRVRQCPLTPSGSPSLAWRDIDVVVAVPYRRQPQRVRPPQAGPGNSFEARSHGFALPVYASQPASPPDHATLGTGWLATPCRAGPSPAEALHEVSALLHASSSSVFIWRTRNKFLMTDSYEGHACGQGLPCTALEGGPLRNSHVSATSDRPVRLPADPATMIVDNSTFDRKTKHACHSPERHAEVIPSSSPMNDAAMRANALIRMLIISAISI
jgi:hypothetical protein